MNAAAETPQTIVTTPFPPQPGFWGAVDKVMSFLVETEVPLAVVIVLLLIGAINEGVRAWAKWKSGGSH